MFVETGFQKEIDLNGVDYKSFDLIGDSPYWLVSALPHYSKIIKYQ